MFFQIYWPVSMGICGIRSFETKIQPQECSRYKFYCTHHHHQSLVPLGGCQSMRIEQSNLTKDKVLTEFQKMHKIYLFLSCLFVHCY